MTTLSSVHYDTPVSILDPSDKFRPGRPETNFRDYTENNLYVERVKKIYYEMHKKQSLDVVNEKLNIWTKFNKAEMSIFQVLEKLDNLIDESDPDINIRNSYHAYQTAERIRQMYPDKPWFHLTGLIHDLGKILAIWGESQCFVVGDTFPVGCGFSNKIVFGRESFECNKDFNSDIYDNQYGIYEKNCGLRNVIMSWGHDEYLYRVLMENGTKLPMEALYIIRYHSFYPWHTEGEYRHLSNDFDIEMLQWVKEFNKFDLYSKADEIPNVDEIKPYYEDLAEQYLPDVLRW